MSALKPSNDKYRRTWKIWGNQMIPSSAYKRNYDDIKWGDQSFGAEWMKEELTSPSHYRIKKFERE